MKMGKAELNIVFDGSRQLPRIGRRPGGILMYMKRFKIGRRAHILAKRKKRYERQRKVLQEGFRSRVSKPSRGT